MKDAGGGRMTDREKAIVMAHTGICMLTGDKFQIFHKYIEDIMGRPVFIHELGDRAIEKEIKEKTKDDFMALCADENSSENPNRSEIKQKCDRINSLASVLPYAPHREIQELLCEIMDMSSVNTEKTGHWEKLSVGYGCSECSLCTNKHGIEFYRYCPNCGAKMEMEE